MPIRTVPDGGPIAGERVFPGISSRGSQHPHRRAGQHRSCGGRRFEPSFLPGMAEWRGQNQRFTSSPARDPQTARSHRPRLGGALPHRRLCLGAVAHALARTTCGSSPISETHSLGGRDLSRAELQPRSLHINGLRVGFWRACRGELQFARPGVGIRSRDDEASRSDHGRQVGSILDRHNPARCARPGGHRTRQIFLLLFGTPPNKKPHK